MWNFYLSLVKKALQHLYLILFLYKEIFMKYTVLLFLLHIICITGFAQYKRLDDAYVIPDSIKASGFYAEVTVARKHPKKNLPGINVNEASVKLGYNKKQKIIQFNFFDKPMNEIAFGLDVYKINLRGYAWNYDWKENETYPLLILTASDSASNKTLYSGYIYLTAEKKWKLIATRIYNDTSKVKFIWPKHLTEKRSSVTHSNRWLLRSNNTWKALDSQTVKPPSFRPMSNIDSSYQQKIEEDAIRAKLPKDSVVYKEGIFYQIVKEGKGRFINVTDTIVVFYKGTLFNDGSLFDETKEKPATFPLNRLIKGWQLGVPYCKVGGKIRLYIPSGSAYGIRTFATDIPPNSTLVFDVEVLEAKEKL